MTCAANASEVTTLWRYEMCILLLLLLLTLNKVNGCNDVSFGDHGVLEGDRIPPLKSHGQALEEFWESAWTRKQ